MPAAVHVNSLLIYLLHYLLFNLRRVNMVADSHASTSFCCRFSYYASYYSFRSHLARAAYLMYQPDPLLRILSTTPLPADLHVNSLLIYLLHYLLFKLRKVTCLMIPMHSAVVSHTTPPILYSADIWPEQPPRCREPASPMECFRCMPTAASSAVMNPLPERDRCGRAAS